MPITLPEIFESHEKFHKPAYFIGQPTRLIDLSQLTPRYNRRDGLDTESESFEGMECHL